MDGWYPVMLNISGRLCVIIGGGSVAERKTAGLLGAGARVRVVSPALAPGLQELARQGRIEWRRKEADPADLDGALLVFAATDDPALNRNLTEMAKAQGMLVNDAVQGNAGNFIVPAVLRRGDFVIAASSSGSSPALAARVIRELGVRYGPEYAEYAAALRSIREAVKMRVSDPEERRQLLLAAAEEAALEEWLNIGQPDPERTVEWLRDRARNRHS